MEISHTPLSGTLWSRPNTKPPVASRMQFVALDKVGNVGKCYRSIVSYAHMPIIFALPHCHSDLLPADLRSPFSSSVGQRFWSTSVSAGPTGGGWRQMPQWSDVLQRSQTGTGCQPHWWKRNRLEGDFPASQWWNQVVDFRAVDKAGREGRCYYSIVSSASPLTLLVWLLLAAALTAVLWRPGSNGRHSVLTT